MRTWAAFISRFANILTNKVYFLNKYNEFTTNYALVEGAELDVEDQVNVPARLSTLLANLNMALRWALANTDPVINGAIRPMIEEAHSLYLALTVVMADLISKNDDPEIVQATLTRYEEERLSLRGIVLRARAKPDLNLFDDVGLARAARARSPTSPRAARWRRTRGRRARRRGRCWTASCRWATATCWPRRSWTRTTPTPARPTRTCGCSATSTSSRRAAPSSRWSATRRTRGPRRTRTWRCARCWRSARTACAWSAGARR